MVLLLAWDRVSEIKDAFDNKQYKPEDVQELFRKLLDDLQNIHEECAEFINSSSWNRPAVYDDDDDDVDYTIAITPVLPTEEPDNSLSIGDEHLDTIPETESDEELFVKSAHEDDGGEVKGGDKGSVVWWIRGGGGCWIWWLTAMDG
nr:hypothetical protein [Tanacetum cinerariifolium]